MEIKLIGKMDHTMDNTFESANRVYGKDGLCPTLPTQCGGGHMPKIMDIVAMRGRNPDNPSDRRRGIELEQRLEINEEGICNTLTTVQKDNMVLEAEALRMVRTEEGKKLRKAYESGEVHHGFNEFREAEPRGDGCTNTITTVQKDNMILTVMGYDEQNDSVRNETFGTLQTDGSSPKHNNRVILVKQATKEGVIPCEVGGGMRSELSRQPNKERKSPGRRTDMPDSDNGEYP